MIARHQQERGLGGGFPILAIVLVLIATGFFFGCKPVIPEGSLVLTQVPKSAPEGGAGLDRLYPTGSRVILVLDNGKTRVLSKGLAAAGAPAISPNGARVFFSGRDGSGEWQIYEADLAGRAPRLVTAIKGGAANPATIDENKIVFSSPAPGRSERSEPSAIYLQQVGASPQRLTFGNSSALEPTVLGDGRILFVSAWARSAQDDCQFGLFTINSDGTELTPFALDGDGPRFVRKPREIGFGRIAFHSAYSEDARAWRTEQIHVARPFKSRAPLQPNMEGCDSVEAGQRGAVLACCEGRVVEFQPGSFEVRERFDDPDWREIEAVALVPRAMPMGHLSTMVSGKKTGTILCLDANLTKSTNKALSTKLKAEKVRILAGSREEPRRLGEVNLHPDGSFMAEVPADTPIGFEAVDAEGRVVRRLAPSIWVRPGENRACVGCHEPYNRSPRNARPMAVTKPAKRLEGTVESIAQK